MARIARVVVPGYPHHVTQRGSRRQPTFFCEQDYHSYITIMADWCQRYGVVVWAYCLMPNHVHLVVVPSSGEGLSRAVGQAHRSYARLVNEREGWTGHLWQERFASFVMDENHLLAAVRYVELNPVRACLVEKAEDYRWSSAQAHLTGQNDNLVSVEPMMERVSDWGSFIDQNDSEDLDPLRQHTRNGRPLGSDEFVAGLEKIFKRPMRPLKAGRKKK